MLTDYVVTMVFIAKNAKRGQERQNENSLNVLFPAKMSDMDQLLNPPHLFFGVLGPLGVLGDKMTS